MPQQNKTRPTAPPPTEPASPRDLVNATAIDLVARGFEAIDQLAEIGKRELKKAIIRGMSAPRKPRP